MNETFVYEHNGSLYINLTNSCTNSCDFCIRNKSDGIDGYDLWLNREPSAREVIKELEKYGPNNYSEVVFCGYGEPTMRLDVLLECARYMKENYSAKPVRINTNGQGNLYHNKDITPQFEGLIDKISISLNAPSEQEYQNICHSIFGNEAYEGLLVFARHAKSHVGEVRLTVVDIIGKEKIDRCKEVADKHNLKLYVRRSQ